MWKWIEERKQTEVKNTRNIDYQIVQSKISVISIDQPFQRHRFKPSETAFQSPLFEKKPNTFPLVSLPLNNRSWIQMW